MKKRKNYLLKVKKSRKSYFFLYLMALVVLGVLIYFYKNNYEIDNLVFIFSGIFIVGIFFITEILHAREWWAITDSSLIHSISILNKNVREVDFGSISDMDLDKPLFKRLFNYGTVNVRVFLNETSIHVKDINNPEKFINLLQDLIKNKRSKKNVPGAN
jgi:membrane protein YdbS with pleckstrin-like domain